MQSKNNQITDISREQVLRERKRVSRNDETLVFDGMLYLLAMENLEIVMKKTKKTIHTFKMLIPQTITQRDTGKFFNQKAIQMLSKPLLETVLGYEHLDTEAMTDKQLKRTKEATINNGVLYLLYSLGYSFVEKKTKKSNRTERLIRIESIKYGDIYFNRDILMSLGSIIEQSVRDVETGETIRINNETIRSIDPNCFLTKRSNVDLTNVLELSGFSQEEITKAYNDNGKKKKSKTVKIQQPPVVFKQEVPITPSCSSPSESYSCQYAVSMVSYPVQEMQPVQQIYYPTVIASSMYTPEVEFNTMGFTQDMGFY